MGENGQHIPHQSIYLPTYGYILSSSVHYLSMYWYIHPSFPFFFLLSFPTLWLEIFGFNIKTREKANRRLKWLSGTQILRNCLYLEFSTPPLTLNKCYYQNNHFPYSLHILHICLTTQELENLYQHSFHLSCRLEAGVLLLDS